MTETPEQARERREKAAKQWLPADTTQAMVSRDAYVGGMEAGEKHATRVALEKAEAVCERVKRENSGMCRTSQGMDFGADRCAAGIRQIAATTPTEDRALIEFHNGGNAGVRQAIVISDGEARLYPDRIPTEDTDD